MLTRPQIKQIAKERFQGAYWPSVGAYAVVLGIALGVSMFNFLPILGFISLAASIIIVALGVGQSGFYLNVYRGESAPRVGQVFEITFTQNFGRKLGGMLWMELFLFLWALPASVVFPVSFLISGIIASTAQLNAASLDSGPPYLGWFAFNDTFLAGLAMTVLLTLLAFIPVFIKSLSYSMTPYILADCPNVPAQKALTLSKRMTRGNKGEIFVMMLSFLGWCMLSAFTVGLLDIFWTTPYMSLSLAGQYDELKRRALENGTVTLAELEGTPDVI